ncbi:cupin [Sphingomonas flavalba]|uniref:cupin n=1 Tax=Sphingomonas flavalba TaxID=2559804 RepID=UPI00109E349C|nr:cupin [Sphingomonas flavalba]
MAIPKEHREFHPIAMDDDGWQLPEGYAPGAGVDEKILSGRLDLAAKRGSRTRLLRFQPGVFTTRPFVHDYWEEVFLVSGDLTVGNDENGDGGERFVAPTYACRPPGVFHGPFKSEGGCLLLETHYYDPA